MIKDRVLTLGRAVAFGLLLSLLEHARLLRMAIGPALGTQTSPELLVISWTWIGLTLAAIIGLADGRRWGAYALGLLVPVSTLLLSIPLFPVITTLVPQEYRPYAMVLANIAVLATVPILLKQDRRQVATAPQANGELR